jgi:hypothetical protein
LKLQLAFLQRSFFCEPDQAAVVVQHKPEFVFQVGITASHLPFTDARWSFFLSSS